MDHILIGNIVALIGAGLMVAGGFLKGRRNILLLQCVQFGVQTGSNLLLGGVTGAVSNILSIARNLFCLRWSCPLPVCLAFVAVQAGITLGVNDMGAIGWLPVAATAAFTLVINSRDPVVLKLAVIVGQTCWGVYDLTIRNYAGLAFDVFAVLSNLWGIFLVRRGKGEKGNPVSRQGMNEKQPGRPLTASHIEAFRRERRYTVKNKMLVIAQALLWCIAVLAFPIISGTLSAIWSLDAIETLFLQGFFMVMSLIPPAVLAAGSRWSGREVGFSGIDLKKCRKAFYFIPLLAIFIPVAVKGFYIKSAGYLFGSLFLYLFVGISEEVYFRGIIPRYLQKEFSTGGVVAVSTFIFGIAHIASAFAGNNVFEIVLTVLNAFIFGWLAMEMKIISSSIIPGALVHFMFDFETKIVAMSGETLLTAECIRGAIMFAAAVWLAVVRYRDTMTTEGTSKSSPPLDPDLPV